MDLKRATQMLAEGEYTCVLCQGEIVHTSTLRGVKPLVQWLVQGTELTGFSAADRVIGKATAYLYILHGVRRVYARVISIPALGVLQEAGIEVQYGTLTENIINRKGDGICPFEAAVMNAIDPQDAYRLIMQKMQELNISL